MLFYSGCRLDSRAKIQEFKTEAYHLFSFFKKLKPTTVLSVVFSLFYFFQYVKERFADVQILNVWMCR